MRAIGFGIVTALGVILAIVAVFNDVRLDWAETALIAGVTLIAVGSMMLCELVKGLTREGGFNGYQE